MWAVPSPSLVPDPLVEFFLKKGGGGKWIPPEPTQLPVAPPPPTFEPLLEGKSTPKKFQPSKVRCWGANAGKCLFTVMVNTEGHRIIQGAKHINAVHHSLSQGMPLIQMSKLHEIGVFFFFFKKKTSTIF
jgi:hypothetical protein